VALVHAGWRGLEAGIIAHTLSAFDAHATHAFVGPSISKERYQVGPDVAQYFGSVPEALTPDGGDRSRLDLRLVATRQLVDAGVADDHIVRSRDVTDGGEIFFSDRAQRPCGRFAIVAKRVVA
jgi:copper oxidase (laccase) domain-containing protein